MVIDEILFATIFGNEFSWSELADIKEIEKLISDGADVNYIDYFSKHCHYEEPLLSMVIKHINSSDEKIGCYYRDVSELLITNGADVNLFGGWCDYCEIDLGEKCDDEFCGACNKYTPLDWLILQGGEHGINQNTYRLAKIMITSLPDKELVKYYRNHCKPQTKNGLINILKEFNKYDKLKQYPEYLI